MSQSIKPSKIGKININLLYSYPRIVILFSVFFLINLLLDIVVKISGQTPSNLLQLTKLPFIGSLDIGSFVLIMIVSLLLITKSFCCICLFFKFVYHVSIAIILTAYCEFCLPLIDNIYNCSNFFAMLSIVVSLLSATVAGLTIMFGNFSICGIGSNSILKYVFQRQFLLCRLIIFSSPLFLFILLIFNLEYSFFVLFLLSILSLVFLLHLCVSVFVDAGVRYELIPKYISMEMVGNASIKLPYSQNSMHLYREFIHNFNCVMFTEFSEVYVNLFYYLLGNNENNKNSSIRFKTIYYLLNDTQKYILQNSIDKNDGIKYYFELCFKIFNRLIIKDDFVYIAIFQNIIEIIKLTSINEDEYSSELLEFYIKTLEKDSDDYSKLKKSIILLFIMEICMSSESIDFLSNTIDECIARIIDYTIIKNVIEIKFKDENIIQHEKESILGIIFNLFVSEPNTYEKSSSYINALSKKPGFIAACIINVWHDICDVINKKIMVVGKSNQNMILDFFKKDSDFKSKRFMSNIFTIYYLFNQTK